MKAQRDPALAAEFAPPAAAVAPPAPGATPAVTPAAEKPAVPDTTTERISARANGVDFEIPVYKYEAIFRPYEELLEKKADAKK